MTIAVFIDKLIDGIIRGCLLGFSVTIVFYGLKLQIQRIKDFIKKRKEKRTYKKNK